MANVQRLTKRVNELEEWTKANEMTGGPQGILETFTFLINEARMAARGRMQIEQSFQQIRAFSFEFIQQHELTDEWNEFLKEKEDAVQKQATEEIPALTEAEDGEEVGKEDTKGKKPSKKESKEAKK